MEEIVSHSIVPTPYAHEYPTVLVLLLGALWEAAFAGVPFFPPGIWDAKSRIVLGNVSRLFGLSSFVLRRFVRGTEYSSSFSFSTRLQGFSRSCRLPQLLPFSLFLLFFCDPPFLEGLSYYILLSS